MKLSGSPFIPSLKYIAFSRIAANLWIQQRITPLCAQQVNSQTSPESPDAKTEWQKITEKVLGALVQLPLPEPLREECAKHVEGVGMRIFRWFYSHQNLYHDHSSPTGMFCWTPHGTIDEKKTAEKLVQDESLPMSKRYALACLYCLEEYIYSFNKKVGYNTLKRNMQELHSSDVKQLVCLWSDYVNGKYPKKRRHPTFANSGFKIATDLRNVGAMKFFFDKLSAQEKKGHLVESAKRILETYSGKVTPLSQANATYFLLSVMDDNEQMEVFNCHQWDLFNVFATWPWIECFIELVEHSKSSFSKMDYFALFEILVSKAAAFNDCDYVQLFTRYWHEITIDCKKYCVAKILASNKFIELFEVGDRQLITLVLEDASVSQKEAILFAREDKNVLLSLIKEDKWEMALYSLTQCLGSMDNISKVKRCKQDFKRYERKLGFKNVSLPQKHLWGILFKLIDECIRQITPHTTGPRTSVKRRRRT